MSDHKPVEAPKSGEVARSAGGADATTMPATNRSAAGGAVVDATKPADANIKVQGADGKDIVDPNAPAPVAVDPNAPVAKVYTPEEQTAISDPKFGKFTKAFIDNGTLSDAEVTEAATASGVPEAMVREYVRGQEALRNAGKSTPEQAQLIADQTTRNNLAFEFSKDINGWQDFGAWTVQHLSQEQRNAIEAAMVNSPKDPTTARVVVKTFYDQFKAAAGGAPRDVTLQAGSANETHATGGYASQQEMVTAMNDPRYTRDPVYNAEVGRKVAASNFA